MTTEQQSEKTESAFVRIDPGVRDRLRTHCQEKGLVMGRFVSKLVTAALDAGEVVPAMNGAGGRRSPRKTRRKPARKARRKK